MNRPRSPFVPSGATGASAAGGAGPESRPQPANGCARRRFEYAARRRAAATPPCWRERTSQAHGSRRRTSNWIAAPSAACTSEDQRHGRPDLHHRAADGRAGGTVTPLRRTPRLPRPDPRRAVTTTRPRPHLSTHVPSPISHTDQPIASVRPCTPAWWPDRWTSLQGPADHAVRPNLLHLGGSSASTERASRSPIRSRTPGKATSKSRGCPGRDLNLHDPWIRGV